MTDIQNDLQGKKALFQTTSGTMIDLLDVKPKDVSLQDIAHGLSNQCRYNGHTKRFYSVAEHCVRLANISLKLHPNKPDMAMYLLLHDASEAYVGDIVYHLKALLPHYRHIEEEIQKVIMAKYKVDHVLEDVVTSACCHALDRRISYDEMKQLMPSLDPTFKKEGVFPLRIKAKLGWSPKVAKKKYLDTYIKINNKMEK